MISILEKLTHMALGHDGNDEKNRLWRDFDEGIHRLFLPSFVDKVDKQTSHEKNASSFRTHGSNSMNRNISIVISCDTFDGEFDTEVDNEIELYKTNYSAMNPFPKTYERMKLMCQASMEDDSNDSNDDEEVIMIGANEFVVPKSVACDSNSHSSMSSDNPLHRIPIQNNKEVSEFKINGSDFDRKCLAAAARQIMERQSEKHNIQPCPELDTENDMPKRKPSRIPSYIYLNFNADLDD